MNIPNGNISYSRLKARSTRMRSIAQITILLQQTQGIMIQEMVPEIEVLTETWKYEQNLLPNLKLELYKSYASSGNRNRLNVFKAQKRYGYGELFESSSGELERAVTVNAQNEVLRPFRILFSRGIKVTDTHFLIAMIIISSTRMKKKTHTGWM